MNQETILGGEELGIFGYPQFNSPHQEADALAGAGFNVILQATNHALDAGVQEWTIRFSIGKNNYPGRRFWESIKAAQREKHLCL